MKKRIVFMLIISLTIAVSAFSLYASFAWYLPDAPSGYVFDLVADSVYSIYFSSTEVETEGELIPANAMTGAVAEGKYFDVKREYDPLAPEYNGSNPDICKSYVSEIAQELSYSTKFINRGADTILVEYEWYITLASNPLERLDKDEFAFDVDFWNIALEEEITPDENNRFYLSPVGDSRTIEIDLDVTMYFAKVDELMDPRLKGSELLVTIDIRRIWELPSEGYMEIRFATDDPNAEGSLYPAGEDSILFSRDFSYAGGSNYLANVSWFAAHYETLLEPTLFIVDITFTDKIAEVEIIPDIDGKINIPAGGTVQVDIEVAYATSEIPPELLNQRLYVTIAIGTAP